MVVGAIAGWALVSQVGREQERQLQDVPLLKLFILYHAVLLERLAEQLKNDEVTWCERLAEGYCESFELQHFIDSVRDLLILRVDVPGRSARRRADLKEDINELHKEAQVAVTAWTLRERDREKVAGHYDRQVVADAERDCVNARGQAERRCCFLLGHAYRMGNRSMDHKVACVKRRLAHDGVDHGMAKDPVPNS